MPAISLLNFQCFCLNETPLKEVFSGKLKYIYKKPFSTYCLVDGRRVIKSLDARFWAVSSCTDEGGCGSLLAQSICSVLLSYGANRQWLMQREKDGRDFSNLCSIVCWLIMIDCFRWYLYYFCSLPLCVVVRSCLDLIWKDGSLQI